MKGRNAPNITIPLLQREKGYLSAIMLRFVIISQQCSQVQVVAFDDEVDEDEECHIYANIANCQNNKNSKMDDHGIPKP
jgi:hypothetical protein